MKRRGHLIETAKPSIIDIGNIVPIGTIEFIKIVLKKSRPGCLRASFCFVNTRKVAPPCGRKSMKGHQTHRRNFYFESCVCQKKRINPHLYLCGLLVIQNKSLTLCVLYMAVASSCLDISAYSRHYNIQQANAFFLLTDDCCDIGMNLSLIFYINMYMLIL